jgi:bacterioferritin-associated ferredoxin|tara:strand:- start:15492 stop:15818 length:327 start_codon:yes stop_codon:yes gene_type:complete
MRAIVTHNAIANHSQGWHVFTVPPERAGNRRKAGPGNGRQMIVCVCNAKNCRTVREVLANAPHVDTPAAAHRAMGCKPQCGRCLPTLAGMIEEVRNETAMATALAAAD